MSFIDCLAITLFNAVICITLPKMLSWLQTTKANRSTQLRDIAQEMPVSEYVAQQAVSEPISLSS